MSTQPMGPAILANLEAAAPSGLSSEQAAQLLAEVRRARRVAALADATPHQSQAVLTAFEELLERQMPEFSRARALEYLKALRLQFDWFAEALAALGLALDLKGVSFQSAAQYVALLVRERDDAFQRQALERAKLNVAEADARSARSELEVLLDRLTAHGLTAFASTEARAEIQRLRAEVAAFEPIIQEVARYHAGAENPPDIFDLEEQANKALDAVGQARIAEGVPPAPKPG